MFFRGQLLLVLFAALLLLAACSKSDSGAVLSTAPDAPAVETAPSEKYAAGQAVYLRSCVVCHLVNGQGVPATFPPLAGSDRVTAADPGRIIRATLHGLRGPITVNGRPYNNIMPPQGAVLTDRELADALTYVRQSWGHQASAVTTAEVAAIRRHERRSTPWTWPELERH